MSWLWVGMGGFTTFSAFAMESVTLLRSGQIWEALGYAAGSTLIGLFLAFVGFCIFAAG